MSHRRQVRSRALLAFLVGLSAGCCLTACDDQATQATPPSDAKPTAPASSLAEQAKQAKTPAEALVLREKAYALAPSTETLLPLVDVLEQLGRNAEARKRASIERERALAATLQPFAVGRVKELRLLPSAEGALGRVFSPLSGSCPAQLERCPLVVFGKTALTPLPMTCGEPSPMSGAQLLEKVPALKGWEQAVGERADRDNLGLKPLDVDGVTTVDLNGDKRPDRLYAVSLVVDAQPASKRSCLLGEVNGRFALLEGTLCFAAGSMEPVQAFKVNQVPGMFLRVLRQTDKGTDAFIAHYVKGALREVLADCHVDG